MTEVRAIVHASRVCINYSCYAFLEGEIPALISLHKYIQVY